MNSYCQHSDRDFKNMKCGYPLPCPYHTVIIDTTRDEVKIKVPQNKSIDSKVYRRLRKIGRVALKACKEKLGE